MQEVTISQQSLGPCFSATCASSCVELLGCPMGMGRERGVGLWARFEVVGLGWEAEAGGSQWRPSEHRSGGRERLCSKLCFWPSVVWGCPLCGMENNSSGDPEIGQKCCVSLSWKCNRLKWCISDRNCTFNGGSWSRDHHGRAPPVCPSQLLWRRWLHISVVIAQKF